MPSAKIEGPALTDLDVKRELVKDVTDALVKAFGMPKEIMVVLIKENSAENVGVGGELIVDRLNRNKINIGLEDNFQSKSISDLV